MTETIKIKSKVLFARHEHDGSDVWPIAMTETAHGLSYEYIPGFWAMFESMADMSDVLSLDGVNLYVGGLWVYEIEYDAPDDSVPHDDWSHLRGGGFRRPTPDEVTDLFGEWRVVL